MSNQECQPVTHAYSSHDPLCATGLPSTGLDVTLLILGAVAMTAIGVALRRLTNA